MTSSPLPTPKINRTAAERAARAAASQQEAEYDAELVRRFNANKEVVIV